MYRRPPLYSMVVFHEQKQHQNISIICSPAFLFLLVCLIMPHMIFYRSSVSKCWTFSRSFNARNDASFFSVLCLFVRIYWMAFSHILVLCWLFRGGVIDCQVKHFHGVVRFHISRPMVLSIFSPSVSPYMFLPLEECLHMMC